MKHYATLAVISCLLLQSFSASAQCNPSKPKNLFLTDQTGCSATLHWKSIPNIGFYSVKYKAAGTTKWKGQKAVGTDTSFTFSLSARWLWSLPASMPVALPVHMPGS